MLPNYFLVFAGLLSSLFYLAQGQSPTVKINDGTIFGSAKVTSTLFKYDSYEGLRYAQPPLGNLRFKDPKPICPLQGTYNATLPGSQCLAPNGAGDTIGSEDCLFLNIYVPTNFSNCPVIVYIHGGAFAIGSSTFRSPELFVEQGTIFVSFEYRLGPLGYLCLHTPKVPGNAGMKDQSLALKWIKKYIFYFRGDPNNISIFGDSAGGVSVQLQQISPMSRDLMNKIMSISGASLNEAGIQRNPLGKASQLANLLGLTLNSTSFLQELQAKSAVDIIKAAQNVTQDTPGSIQDIPFSPVIEHTHPGVEAFINKEPIEYYRSGSYTHVPIMIGQTSKEFAVFFLAFGPAYIQILIQDFPGSIIPKNWLPVLSINGIQAVKNVILNFFFGTTTINLSDHDQLESAIDLLGDILVTKGTNTAVRELAKTSKAPVYYYEFSFTGVLNGQNILPLGIVGATHVDEMLYLCPSENSRIGVYTPDGWTRRRLMAFYQNLIHKGNPTPGPYSNLLPTKWLPVTNQTLNYMEINGALTPSYNPDEHRMKFWMDTEKRVFSGEFN